MIINRLSLKVFKSIGIFSKFFLPLLPTKTMNDGKEAIDPLE